MKFDVDSRNETKRFFKVFSFKDNCFLIGDNKFSQSRKGYLSLAVNVLRNIRMVQHIIKGDIFTARFYQSDGKIWWKCSDADFTRASDSLTCWLSNNVLKHCFLESGLTITFTVFYFRNKVAMTIIFLSKMFQTWYRFQK